MLIFVSVITVKAINKDIEAKQNLNKNDYGKYENKKTVMKKIKYSMTNETNELIKLHSEGILSNEELKTAKEKNLL